ncbi:MAG: hypothetical protein AABX30_03555 [Nanoarchaeota archaeon]
MRKFNPKILIDKRASTGFFIGRLIAIILIVLVIVTFVMFIFKADILSWIRNLPGYSTPEDQEIDAGDIQDKSVSGTENIDCSIGLIKDKNIYISNVDTNLLWMGNDKSAVIWLNEWWGEKVGEVVDGKIIIKGEWISDTAFRNKHPKIPSAEKLQKLNGAFYDKDRNLICKLIKT